MSRQHCAIACSVERFGRKPLERSWNFASHIGSSTCRIHCCTIRSTIVGIPSGLVFPLGFGISTRLTGRGLYQLNCFWISRTNFSSSIEARCLIVLLSTPGVPLPLFPLIVRYASLMFSSLAIRPTRFWKVLPFKLSAYRRSKVFCRS